MQRMLPMHTSQQKEKKKTEKQEKKDKIKFTEKY